MYYSFSLLNRVQSFTTKIFAFSLPSASSVTQKPRGDMFTPRWHTPSTRAYARLHRFFPRWMATGMVTEDVVRRDITRRGKKIEISIEGPGHESVRSRSVTSTISTLRFYGTERSSSCRTRVTDKTCETSSSLARTSIERYGNLRQMKKLFYTHG